MSGWLFVVHAGPEALGEAARLLPARIGSEPVLVRTPREARALLAARRFDVVVVDLDVHGFDAVSFLSDLRVRHPDVVRVGLTASADARALTAMLRDAHRVLHKPLQPNAIDSLLADARGLRELLADRDLQRLVGRLGHLPSVPAVYRELTAEFEVGEPSLNRIGRIVARDAALSTMVLRLVNSAFFGVAAQVKDPGQAVCMLGFDTVRALALGMGIQAQFHRPDLARELEVLWAHGLCTAGIARAIAATEVASPFVASDAFTAGLVHDVGQLVLATSLTDEYQLIVAQAAERDAPRPSVERERLGASHAEVGAYLLSLWGLPPLLIDVARWHHEPAACPASHEPVLTAVHVADALSQDPAELDQHGPARVDYPYLERAGYGDRFDAWRQAAAPYLTRSDPG